MSNKYVLFLKKDYEYLWHRNLKRYGYMILLIEQMTSNTRFRWFGLYYKSYKICFRSRNWPVWPSTTWSQLSH